MEVSDQKLQCREQQQQTKQLLTSEARPGSLLGATRCPFTQARHLPLLRFPKKSGAVSLTFSKALTRSNRVFI
jgi:hypothetical protein